MWFRLYVTQLKRRYGKPLTTLSQNKRSDRKELSVFEETNNLPTMTLTYQWCQFFLSLLLRFISDIISHKNRLFNIILHYVCNRILWSFVKRFICEREKCPSQYSKKDLALLNLLTVLLKYDPCRNLQSPPS